MPDGDNFGRSPNAVKCSAREFKVVLSLRRLCGGFGPLTLTRNRYIDLDPGSHLEPGFEFLAVKQIGWGRSGNSLHKAIELKG
jgi:hypothetical protein